MVRSFRKWLAMFCAACLICSMFASAVSFKDKDQIVNQTAVDTLAELHIVDGYADGTFRPDVKLSRAEFCKLAYLAAAYREQGAGFRDDSQKFASVQPAFSDISDHWAKNYITALYEAGVLAGTGSGLFQPDDSLTGFEMAKMLLVIGGADAERDGLTGGMWLSNTETLARKMGLLNGYTPSLSNRVTRDHAARMIYNLLFNKGADNTVCMVTRVNNTEVAVLTAEGTRGTYTLAAGGEQNVTAGQIYYYVISNGRISLYLPDNRADVTVLNGAQTYWSGDQVATIDMMPYATDENTVVFLKYNRSGHSGQYVYDYAVYEAHSLRDTYAGSAAADAVLHKDKDGKFIADVVVCDMDTLDVNSSSNTQAAYGTGVTGLYSTEKGREIANYPMFAGVNKGLYLVADAVSPSDLTGKFVLTEVNRQGRLKREPVAVSVSQLARTHELQQFVLGEITGYDAAEGIVSISAGGENRVLALDSDANIVFIDSKRHRGVSTGSVKVGKGKNNAVYLTDGTGKVTALFVDIAGEIVE